MGQKPDVIEQEIRDKRDTISNKIDRMASRGADDMREIGSRVENFFEEKGVASTAQEHPFATLAGAVGLGVALGLASGSVHLPGGSGRDADYRERDTGRRHGNSPGIISSILAPIEAAAVAQGTELIREWLGPSREGERVREQQPAPDRDSRQS
jgi:hypothetical protein